jgi:pyroglutamyl-peptidase
MIQAPPVVLVSGFEPNDAGVNASELLVRSLVADLPLNLAPIRDRLRFAILPGDTNALTKAIEGLLEEHQPDVWLLTGQAPGRGRVTFERIATNFRDFMVPDRAGNFETGSPILATAPAAYFSTLGEASHLADLLQREGVPAAPSNHAGNHLCNQALFTVLHLATSAGTRAGFMHVPLLPEQVVGRWVEHPSMTLEAMRQAVACTLLHAAVVRRQSRDGTALDAP